MATVESDAEILVGIDGSCASATAVRWAAHDAELRNRALRLVHVVPPIVMPRTPWPELPVAYARCAEERAQHITARACAAALEAAPARASSVATQIVHGPVVPTLAAMSKEAEMLVVGCLGETAARRALVGSISSAVVHRSHCPVAVIHGEQRPSPKAPVIVGIDGSEESALATAIAFDEAARRDVGLVAVHAWSDMGPLGLPDFSWAPIDWRDMEEHEEKEFAAFLAPFRDQYPDVPVHPVVVCDRPANRLLQQADAAQLIVVGSHGRGGVTGALLGSVSTAVVQSAQIPVIVARQG
ncbi:universal stress protein [Mycolicibacterium iranicum]|uniref:Universal stress protein n=1 Tax=Mycolicibacterium iranicum TaxID=912594 RepID=A0A178M0G2_MYCIR|nr:universal stress protein [Mycolicibacterium iranicum]OAN39893.1 universal stress protein [Mycolicibacterium iranicum]